MSDAARTPGSTAEKSTGRINGPIVSRGASMGFCQKAPDLARANSTTPLTGPMRCILQFVELTPERRRELHFLNGIIAGVSHQVIDCVQAVRLETASISAFVHLYRYPIIIRTLPRLTRINKTGDVCRIPSCDCARQDARQRLHELIGNPVNLCKARLTPSGWSGIKNRAFWRVDMNRPKCAIVLRHARATS